MINSKNKIKIRRKQHSVLNVTKAMDRGSRQARKERIAAVKV